MFVVKNQVEYLTKFETYNITSKVSIPNTSYFHFTFLYRKTSNVGCFNLKCVAESKFFWGYVDM